MYNRSPSLTEDPSLQLILNRIRAEAERRMAHSIPEPEAYTEAIVQVFTVAAKELAVTPFEAQILTTMRRLGSPTIALKKGEIAQVLHESGMGVDEWTLWNSLHTLEARGLIYRPNGPRSHRWNVAA